MTVVHELSRTEARRIAVRAQLLDGAAHPTGLLDVARHLTLLQLDQANAVAPSAELVAWSRLGDGVTLGDVQDAVDHLELIDLRGMARPGEDIVLYRADMARWATRTDLNAWQEDVRDWMDANEACRQDILAVLRTDGPLPTRELPDTCAVPWRSSGWNNDRDVRMLVDLMVSRGDVAAAGPRPRRPALGSGRRACTVTSRPCRARKPVGSVTPVDSRHWGSPDSTPRATRRSSRTASVTPASGQSIDGVRGEWRVDPAQLGQRFSGRLALLSPLDRLVYDRKRMVDLFEFDYQLEMYKPAAKRRWGYWALPILYGDRLVGKVDAKADHVAGALRVSGHPSRRRLHQGDGRPARPRDRPTRELARSRTRPVAVTRRRRLDSEPRPASS